MINKTLNRLKKLSAFDILIVIINAVLLLYLFEMDYVLMDDSASYINNKFFRTPSYPLFLDFFERLFGTHYLSFAVYFQILLSFSVSFILSNTLRRYLGFGKYLFLIIYLQLLYPVYGSMNISNKIITESLTYSCLLIAINYLVVFVFEKRIKHLIYFLSLSVLILSIRPQFIFLYVIDFIVILYHTYKTKNLKQFSILFILLLALIFSSSIFERTYNYINHGFFSKIPFTGIQLITPQLYLSDKTDLELFEDYSDEQRTFLENIYSDIEARKINYENNFMRSAAMPSSVYSLHFMSVYNDICWLVVVNNYARMKGTNKNNLTPEQLIELDDFTISVSLKLLPVNYARLIKLYISNILYALGGFSSAIFAFIITTTFFILLFKTKDEIYLLFSIVQILYFMNIMFVALFQPVLRRYSIYTDILQVVFLTAFLFCVVIKMVLNNYKLNSNYVRNSR